MSHESKSGVKARHDIIDAALSRFAADGFSATSIQHVADDCGYSKSSVLYHFDSKERMLDAALTPALASLEQLLDRFPAEVVSPEASKTLLELFVDFLLTYRREAAIVLIQGQSLGELPVMRQANALVSRLADLICASTPDLSTRMRVGVGLAGAAFVLAVGTRFLRTTTPPPDDEVRTALIGALAEMFRLEN